MTPYNPRDLEKKVWDCCLNVKSSKEKPFVSKRTQEVFESDNGRFGCRRFMQKHFVVQDTRVSIRGKWISVEGRRNIKQP